MCKWSLPPRELLLSPGEVHVWCAQVSSHVEHLDQLLTVLHKEERQRAQAYYFPKHRNGFIVRWGLLRVLLARYLDCEPEGIRFEVGEFGKPHLKQTKEDLHVQFNLSHSEDICLFAFAQQTRLGIDVEHIRTDLDFDNIVRRYFSSAEQTQLLSLKNKQRTLAFFTAWTRKEAFIKALGGGLSIPLDQFSVSMKPAEPAVLLNLNLPSIDKKDWSLIHLHPGESYVGALAVEHSSPTVHCWNFSS